MQKKICCKNILEGSFLPPNWSKTVFNQWKLRPSILKWPTWEILTLLLLFYFRVDEFNIFSIFFPGLLAWISTLLQRNYSQLSFFASYSSKQATYYCYPSIKNILNLSTIWILAGIFLFYRRQYWNYLE